MKASHLKIPHIFMLKNPTIFKNRIEYSFFNWKKMFFCASPTTQLLLNDEKVKLCPLVQKKKKNRQKCLLSSFLFNMFQKDPGNTITHTQKSHMCLRAILTDETNTFVEILRSLQNIY